MRNNILKTACAFTCLLGGLFTFISIASADTLVSKQVAVELAGGGCGIESTKSSANCGLHYYRTLIDIYQNVVGQTYTVSKRDRKIRYAAAPYVYFDANNITQFALDNLCFIASDAVTTAERNRQDSRTIASVVTTDLNGTVDYTPTGSFPVNLVTPTSSSTIYSCNFVYSNYIP